MGPDEDELITDLTDDVPPALPLDSELRPRRAQPDSAPSPGRSTMRPLRSRSTMRDVAQLSGVSIKSVSRVVNQDPNVSPKMRERVDRAVRQLGFVPDASAAALRRSDHRTRILCVVLQDLGNHFSSRLFHQLENSPRLRNYALLTASLEERPKKERRIVNDLLERRVDGLILTPTSSNQEYLQASVDAGLAVICVDRRPSGLSVDSVTTDNWLGAVKGTEHLISRGHRRIAFLGDFTAIESSNDRLAGHLDALRSAGIVADPRLIYTGIRSVEDGRAALDALFLAGVEFTAVFSARNDLTVGAVSCLQAKGLQHEIGLVGFDDTPMSRLLDPPLTVVEQDIEVLADHTAERIIARVGGDDSAVHDIVVAPHLIERGSGEIPIATRPGPVSLPGRRSAGR